MSRRICPTASRTSSADYPRPSPGYTGGWLTPEQARERGGRDVVFSPDDASAALRFARRHASAPVFVVHCDAGWPEFNRHVRETVGAVAAGVVV
jgi:hypothetical protein